MERLNEYFWALKTLSKDCNFQAVSATQHCEEYIKDAFISGLLSQSIRQRLLENKTLDLSTMVDQARTLDSAQRNTELYDGASSFRALGATCEEVESDKNSEATPVMAVVSAKCFFCGLSKHPRFKCPARDANCNKCRKKGHYVKVCRSAPTNVANCSTLVATPSVLSKAVTKIIINGSEVDCLIDSGSSESFIHPDLIERHSLAVNSFRSAVTMAATSLSAQTTGFCEVDLKVDGQDYSGVRLTVLPKLCADM